jgi:hypothetical protein
MTLHQFEDGPILEATHQFLPGETAYFNTRLAGFAVAGTGDEQRTTKLNWKVDVADPRGVPIVPPATGRISLPVHAEDKNWFPKFSHSFTIPPFAESGAYKITVSGKDEVGGTEFEKSITIPVRGITVEPSDKLTIRNLRFTRDEEGRVVLTPAVYQPGETLWARFEITGYQFGAKNHYAVEYGLAVLRESGERVFEQPSAAADSKDSFYPQRFVPGTVSLNLNKDVAPGDYRLLITSKDAVGNQTAETLGLFRIQP